MAVWLGLDIIVSRCRRKYHDDKKHPDELIHFEQETVGQIANENVEECQKGKKVDPWLVCDSLLEAPQTKREIDAQEQEKTY